MPKKLNVKLIKKVIKHILEEPKRYLQDDIILRGEPGCRITHTIGYKEQKFAKCGTAACIGGWAYLLSLKHPERAKIGRSDELDKARKKLGLDYSQADVLFSGTPEYSWPTPFDARWMNAHTPRKRARVAAQLLAKVIETKGEVLNR